jgi:hypothetical protein
VFELQGLLDEVYPQLEDGKRVKITIEQVD